ncbi:MFS transporter [Streptomyces sp. NPDC000983]|uniref:MFS transporter n=1 Tax=Streptomyces sp. NPDC000983 TaxID=3154373 RepID=UPI003323B418
MSRRYAWVVFALSFGLLLSDYMSRQVLNAVFPMLKADWLLSDARLGSLSGIVALMVGVFTFPLSLLADRWGRVRSLVLAATLWSVATLGCAVAASYGQMFVGRLLVGIGEAAYGSVGIAVVLSVFPRALRATLSGAFIAGGAFGSVLGISIGGAVAEAYGWRWAFGVMGVFGLVLAAVYAVVVTEKRLAPRGGPADEASGAGGPEPLRVLLPRLLSSVSVVSAYVGSGLQLFIAGSLIAWLPSYFNRYYDMPTAKAGATAGLFALVIGIGMIGGGFLADRISRRAPIRKWAVAIGCSLGSLVLLTAAFRLPAGQAQLVVLALGALLCAGTAGPGAAMVANLTPAAIAATAFATLTLAQSLLGLAPGPAVTGALADRLGLLGALRLVPLIALAATAAFLIGRHHYDRDLIRLTELASARSQSGPPKPEPAVAHEGWEASHLGSASPLHDLKAPRPEPTAAHSEPALPHPEPTAAHSESAAPEPEPASAHSKSAAPQPEPASAHSESALPHPQHTSVQPEPTAASAELAASRVGPVPSLPELKAPQPELTRAQAESAPTERETEAAAPPEPEAAQPEPTAARPESAPTEREPAAAAPPEPEAAQPERSASQLAADSAESEAASAQSEPPAPHSEPASAPPEPDPAHPEPPTPHSEPTSPHSESTPSQPRSTPPHPKGAKEPEVSA